MLTSLARQTAPAHTYEVIVSVDGSVDGTLDMLATFVARHALHVAAGPRRGRAAACNAALELVRGDVVIILDDDMQVMPGFVDHHRRHHPEGSRVCVLGAVPVELDDTSSRAAGYVKGKFDAHLARLAEPGHVYVPRDFYSGNTSLRTELLREVGAFNASFTLYGNEDVDLWVRLHASGVEFRYDPEALARQQYGKDLLGLTRDTLEKGRTAVLLARSHPDVFGALRLAQPRDGSRAWLSMRAVCLRMTRRTRVVTAAVFRVAAALERLGLWRQPLFYRVLLDYAFWAGVDVELRHSSTDGKLGRLAVELHRGPIDLLLHG